VYNISEKCHFEMSLLMNWIICAIGSFHLLHTLFTEYVLYMVEALQSRERQDDLLKMLSGQEVDGHQDGWYQYLQF
jgi:hypothetical protein